MCVFRWFSSCCPQNFVQPPPPVLISGFRCGENEISAFRGCYAAFNGSLLPTFRNKLSVPSSMVKQSFLARRAQTFFILAKCVSGYVDRNKHVISQQLLWTVLLYVTLYVCYFLWNATPGVASSSKVVRCNYFFFFFCDSQIPTLLALSISKSSDIAQKLTRNWTNQDQYLSCLGLCAGKEVYHHWYRIWSHLPVCCVPVSTGTVPLLYLPSSRQRSCLKGLWWQVVTVFVQGRSCVRPWVYKMLTRASGRIIGRIMKVTRDKDWVSDGELKLAMPGVEKVAELTF